MTENRYVKFLCLYLLTPAFIINGVTEASAENNCHCGSTTYTTEKDLIISGKPVEDYRQYPFIVSIHFVKDSIRGHCGGALISPDFVLTAAHCIHKTEPPEDCGDKTTPHCYHTPSELQVGLLSEDKEKAGQLIPVELVIPHPKYIKKLINDDIALLKLKDPVECSEYTRPICLTEEDISPVNTKVFIAGFGKNEGSDRVMSSILLEGAVSIVKSSNCERPGIIEAENVLCTVGSDQSSCKGDSGSSAFIKYQDYYYSIGVTSSHSGGKDCEASAPVTFTKVSAYMPFIKKFVKNLEEP